MRVISLCTDGIKDAARKGFFSWAREQDADIICVQDLRASESQLGGPSCNPDGFFSFFHDSIDGKTNGVAIYSRKLPKAVMTGLGECTTEGRFMQADFENISIASILLPPATIDDPGSLARKSRFCEQLQIQLDKVRRKRRQYILCGNWNIARADRDVERAADHRNLPGFLEAERDWMEALFKDLGYIDAFRAVNTDADEYSWWPQGRDAGDGWRVDYQVVSAALGHSIEHGAFYKGQEFASHAPLVMDYDIDVENL